MAEGHSLREVGTLLGLTRSMLRGLIDAGFVSPARGRRHEYRFSFQDLVVLRAARALSAAKLPTVRILRSLRRLRAQLPDTIPLSGLRVEAMGDSVVVVDGNTQWQPDDGQYVLRFQVESPGGRLAFRDRPSLPQSRSEEELFEDANAAETASPEAACALYRRIIAMDETYSAAYTNLGRLFHLQGQMADAESTYADGLARGGPDGILLFNLAVLLEDFGRPLEAAKMYRAALAETPDLMDAHYNLAILCQASGSKQEAFRHLSAYRKLGGKLD